MNKRSVIGALTLLAVLSGTAHAEQLTLNSGARVSAAVSNTDPNYIRVSDDRVISIQATQGVLTSRSPTPDGAVVFSTVAEKPFTLFVQTESGFAFSLQATPGKRAGMSLTVDNSEVRGGEEAREYENKQDSYSALISGLVSRFITNRKPAGYVFTKNRDVPVSAAVSATFQMKPVTAWQGDRIRIVRTDITSRSAVSVRLSERYFWSPGVMAVSFHPRLDVLKPGAQVSVITVFRTKGGADEH